MKLAAQINRSDLVQATEDEFRYARVKRRVLDRYKKWYPGRAIVKVERLEDGNWRVIARQAYCYAPTHLVLNTVFSGTDVHTEEIHNGWVK